MSQQKQRELAAFLPAALEIQESPPNPIAKWISRALIALFCLGVVWAYFGEVDIVAVAEGKIIPSGRVKVIQPVEKAVVKKIWVSEGEKVKTGQLLVELDTVLTEADTSRIQGEIASLQLRLAVSEAFIKQINAENSGKEASELSKPINLLPSETSHYSRAKLNTHQQLLDQQWQEYQSQLNQLHRSLDKAKAEQAANREVISKLSQMLPIITRRTANLKQLSQKKYVSESDYLALEQERIQQKQDLAAERHRRDQLKAAQGEINQQIKTLIAQTSAFHLNQKTELEQNLSALQDELIKAKDLNAKQQLYSPVDGRVQQLAISTVGGVVTEAQALMVIVPDDEQLTVEAYLENKDIGFVRESMPAEVKVHTFPFTKYGVIDAQVVNVSDDATPDDHKGLVFSMLLKMDTNTINVDGRLVKLQPGMAVSTEVKVGKRKVIEFFLSPLMKKQSESLREL